MRTLRVGVLGVAGLSVLGSLAESALLRAAAPVEAAPTFTSMQAADGQAIYARDCARCHGSNLEDGECGPALRGKAFLSRWGGRSVVDLYSLMENTMPPDSPGSLTDRNYIQLNSIAAGSTIATFGVELVAALVAEFVTATTSSSAR